MDDHTERVRRRAYQIWLDEGRPEGREAEHWDMASKLVAIEERQKKTGKPVRRDAGTRAEPSAPAVAKAAAAKPESAVTGRTRSAKVADKKAAPAKLAPTRTPAAKSAAKPEIRPAARKREPTRTSRPHTPKK